MVSKRSEALSSLRGEPTPYPSCSVHELVRAQTRRTPSAIAVSNGTERITYGELEARSNQLGHVLRAHGVKTGTLVALMLDRTPEMVVVLLAILKAGGAYLPLDPTYSSDRLTRMLTASGAPLLISRGDVLTRLSLSITTEVLLVETSEWEQAPTEDLGIPVTPDDTCYVIFTSGSTGEPKGVQIRHGGLVNFLWSFCSTLNVGCHDVMLGSVSISFDVCVQDIFVPLISGARLELATSDEMGDATRLRDRIHNCAVTIMAATPVSWRLLIMAGWSGGENIRILCGGEQLSSQLAAELLDRASSVWNIYGPTEASIAAAIIQIKSASRPIPLGLPFANTSLWVLDESGKPVDPGVPGELYIGGDGLAVGYWNKPDLTAKSFVTIEPEHGYPLRAYRTGDRVRFLPDGNLEFMGRVDLQIKLRGFRIELGEIEHVARSCSGVQDVAVVKVSDAERGDFLAAYVVPKPGEPLFAHKVRAYMQKALPYYMVPASVQIVSRFPVTPNGKVDRAQLGNFAHTEQRTLNAKEEPVGELEVLLESVWGKFLKLQRISRHDNFFEIGGDSLLATQLSAEMSRRFHKHCGVATLHQSPTIALYASFLAGHGATTCVVLNQGSPEMQNQKLFWIDHPERMYHMAGFMEDHPVYSVLLSPDEISMYAPEYRMERLATRMVHHILKYQQEGSFYIGGFCQNALLAYQVSQQLRAQGYDVPLLIMIDPEGATGAPLAESVGQRLRRRWDNESFHVSIMLGQKPSHWLAYLQRRRMNIRFVLNAKRWQRHARTGKEMLLPEAETLTEALFVSQISYVSQPYAGRVLFIQPTLRPRGRDEKSLKGWQKLVSDYRLVEVLGDHMSLFALPGAEMLAQEIKSELKGEAGGQIPKAGTHVSSKGALHQRASAYPDLKRVGRDAMLGEPALGSDNLT